MKFRVISVLGNSVRIRTGIVTFDVLVKDTDGELQMVTPNNIYIGAQDYTTLSGAVRHAYNNTIMENTTNVINKEKKDSN